MENRAGVFEDRANACGVEYDQFFRCNPASLQLSQEVWSGRRFSDKF